MYDSLCGVFKPQYHIRLSAGIKSDLDMWLMILKSFNGVVFFQQLEDLLVLKFFTESAGANHLGWAFGFLPWPMHWNAQEIMKDITFLPLLTPIIIATEISAWGAKLYKRRPCFKLIIFHSSVLLISRAPSLSR